MKPPPQLPDPSDFNRRNFLKGGSFAALMAMMGGVEISAQDAAKNLAVPKRDPNYKEAEIMPHMKGRHIVIEVDVGAGKAKAQVWTCDLTHRYIDINGSYRS